jgi:hypothetical protein
VGSLNVRDAVAAATASIAAKKAAAKQCRHEYGDGRAESLSAARWISRLGTVILRLLWGLFDLRRRPECCRSARDFDRFFRSNIVDARQRLLTGRIFYSCQPFARDVSSCC